jgi:hypothetical protein
VGKNKQSNQQQQWNIQLYPPKLKLMKAIKNTKSIVFFIFRCLLFELLHHHLYPLIIWLLATLGPHISLLLV